jgi:nitrite reductase/ring-hydroxylating ferredoxin subunit
MSTKFPIVEAEPSSEPGCAAAGGRPCARALARRELISLAGLSAGMLVLGPALAGCGNTTGSPPTGPVTAGNISALPAGTMLVMSNIVVARDANGVYGMSAVCTHASCLLDDGSRTIEAGLTCPCHGSAFDGNGAVTAGPARRALQHYAVRIAGDGTITLDGSQPVSADTRTPAG